MSTTRMGGKEKKGDIPRDFFKMGTVAKHTGPGFEDDEDEDES